MHFKQDFYGKTGGGVRKGVEKKPTPIINQKAKGRGRGRGKTYEEPGGCWSIISAFFLILHPSPWSSLSISIMSLLILHYPAFIFFLLLSQSFSFPPFFYPICILLCITLSKIDDNNTRVTGLTVSPHATSLPASIPPCSYLDPVFG